MKKVTLLKSNVGYLGGAEKYAIRLAHAFLDKGCDVTLLTTNSVEKIKHTFSPHLKIINFGSLPKMGFIFLRYFDWQCKKWLNQNPSDIIFGMDRNTFQTHYRAGNGVHAAYLDQRSCEESFLRRLSFKINPLHQTILKFEKQAFENPKLQQLFTNSNLVRAEILKYYQTDPKKIQVVHNGVEWDEMKSDFNIWEEKKAIESRALGLDPSSFQFLFIGNGYRRKGLHFLLNGLARFPEQHFQLSVVGKEKNEKEFRQLAEKLGLQKKLLFFGSRRDIRRFYQIADCVAVPSLYDPFANVTVEAQAMGVYVISSQYNGGAEILTPQSGYTIQNLFDPDSVAKALKKALQNPKTAQRSREIRASVEHLSFSNQLTKIVNTTLEN
jgi:UDP-glucose:(heptosyl)LPS alpha-1,3-glucosyltransferase